MMRGKPSSVFIPWNCANLFWVGESTYFPFTITLYRKTNFFVFKRLDRCWNWSLCFLRDFQKIYFVSDWDLPAQRWCRRCRPEAGRLPEPAVRQSVGTSSGAGRHRAWPLSRACPDRASWPCGHDRLTGRSAAPCRSARPQASPSVADHTPAGCPGGAFFDIDSGFIWGMSA